MILGIMGMIDQIIDFNKSFVIQEVYEKHLYIFIFIALFLCSCGNHKADVATFSDVQMEDTLRAITGAFVNFYVNKTSGTTRMEEYVPTLSRDCHDVPLLAKKRHRHKAMSSFGCPDGLEPSTFRTTI